jgi:hypothetical protein
LGCFWSKNGNITSLHLFSYDLFFKSEDAYNELSTLKSRIEIFYEKGINESSRSPLDFILYKELLWYLDAYTPINGNSKLIYQNFEDLLSLQQEILYSWHSRIWSNNFNSFTILSKEKLDTFNFVRILHFVDAYLSFLFRIQLMTMEDLLNYFKVFNHHSFSKYCNY